MLQKLKTGVAFLVLCAAVASPASAREGRESSVFALFDRGVMSIVAANACKSADSVSLQQFTRDFGQVASLVEAELQGMNPDQRRDDLAMVIGFRIAQLEHRAEQAIQSRGCDAAEVKSMRQLFDLKAQLAMVRLEDHNVTH